MQVPVSVAVDQYKIGTDAFTDPLGGRVSDVIHAGQIVGAITAPQGIGPVVLVIKLMSIQNGYEVVPGAAPEWAPLHGIWPFAGPHVVTACLPTQQLPSDRFVLTREPVGAPAYLALHKGAVLAWLGWWTVRMGLPNESFVYVENNSGPPSGGPIPEAVPGNRGWIDWSNPANH
jgi:hypothetical protein